MSTNQLLAAVRDAGYTICEGTIRYAARIGQIPKPDRTPRGDYVFSRAHLDSILAYLREPRRRGRPRSVSVSIT